MWSLRLGCGQSVPQITRSGKVLDDLAREGDEIAIGIALAVQRRRAGDRQTLGARDLGPDVGVLAHEFEEQRELRAVDRLRHVGAPHVVDDDRRRQGGEEIPELGQIRRLEIDHDMPAELRDAAGDLHQLVLRREVDEPLDEVEAHAAHAGVVQALQLLVADPPRRTVATPRARPALARQASTIARLSAPWQVACTTTLREKPSQSRSAKSSRLARVAGRVFALRRVGELGARPEDVAMRVDRARGQR